MTVTATTVTAVHDLPASVRASTCSPDQLVQLAESLLADLLATVPGSVSATIVTVTATGLRPWASAGPGGADLDRGQTDTRQGPAFTAAGQVEPVVAGDLAADPRWALHLGEQPIRSAITVALPGSAMPPAVLSVYGHRADLTTPSHVEQVLLRAKELTAAVCIIRARREIEDLQAALVTNRAIGAAIGIVMSSRRMTYDAATDLLRAVSNNTNTRLGDLAEAILFTGEIPDAPAPTVRRRRPLPPGLEPPPR